MAGSARSPWRSRANARARRRGSTEPWGSRRSAGLSTRSTQSSSACCTIDAFPARANIDHIVVTGAGVWVIDAKRYQDKRPRIEVEGGLFRPPVEKLIVGGDRTKLVDGVLKQVALVREAVGDVPGSGALCFVDADWPMFGGSFTTRAVEVLCRSCS